LNRPRPRADQRQGAAGGTWQTSAWRAGSSRDRAGEPRSYTGGSTQQATRAGQEGSSSTSWPRPRCRAVHPEGGARGRVSSARRKAVLTRSRTRPPLHREAPVGCALGTRRWGRSRGAPTIRSCRQTLGLTLYRWDKWLRNGEVQARAQRMESPEGCDNGRRWRPFEESVRMLEVSRVSPSSFSERSDANGSRRRARHSRRPGSAGGSRGELGERGRAPAQGRGVSENTAPDRVPVREPTLTPHHDFGRAVNTELRGPEHDDTVRCAGASGLR